MSSSSSDTETLRAGPAVDEFVELFDEGLVSD